MEQKKIRQIFLCLLVLFGINVIQIIVYSLVHLWTGGRLEEENIWVSMVSAIINGGTCLFAYGKIHGKNSSLLTIEEKGKIFRCFQEIARWLTVVLAGAAFCVVVTFGLTAIQILCPQWFTSYNARMDAMDIQASVVTIIYVLLVAPVSEECIFRGLLLSLLSKEESFWFANIVQAVFFGIYHMNLVQGIYAFIMGMILGYVYKYGRNLFASISFHVAFNGTTWIMDQVIPADIAVTWQMFVTAISVGGILCAAALWLLHKTGVKKGSSE